MKCKKCGAEVLKTHNNCPECGNKLKSKKPLILSLFSIILSVLIVLSSGTIAFSVFNEELMKTNSATVTQEGEAADNIPQADLTKPPEIRVQIDDENCFVGQESTVYFRAYTPEKAESVRLVRTDNNAEITNLTVTEQLPDGTWQISGEYTFTPDKAGKINFRAYAGEKFSEETYIRVHNDLPDEAHEEFHNITDELGEYLQTQDIKSISAAEEVELVAEWLESNDSVSEVKIVDNEIHYRTNGGIPSVYSAEVENPYVKSSTTSFSIDTQAIDYYKEWKEDNRSLANYSEGEISYLPSDITITNNKALIYNPLKDTDTNIFGSTYYRVLARTLNLSPKLNGSTVEYSTARSVLDSIANYDLIEYGLVFLCSHGGNDSNDMSGNYLFVLQNSNDKSSYNSIYDDYETVIEDSLGSDWQIRCSSSFDFNTFKMKYKIIVSSRYIMEVYRGLEFDNTFFVMDSCHGFSDEEFNSFLINNGAQGIFGSELTTNLGVEQMVYDNVWAPMLASNDEDISKFVYNFNNFFEADGSVQYEVVDTISVDDYYDVYRRFMPHLPESYDEISDRYPDGFIDDYDTAIQYVDWCFNSLDILERDVEFLENDDGTQSNEFLLTYSLGDSDIYEYLLQNDDYSLGADGSITGTLYNGTVTRTYSPGGGYTDVNNKGEILKDTEIAAYRFLNQSFKEELTVTSGKDGKFTFKAEDDGVFPWGHYVIASKDEDYDGEASIILVEHATNGGDLILHGGKSTLSGIVQGEKSATDKSLVILKDAKINLVDSRGDTVASTSAGSDGSFTFKDIEKGTYTLVFTCKDYEKLTMSVNIENGFVYQYSLGCIILEPIESIMDVVLVLDTSGSMSGDPIDATKSAASQFANTVLGADKSCRVGVVTYDSGSYTACGFTKYASTCNPIISNIGTGGGTDIESGLSAASSLLSQSEARNKIIVLMSDGEPNEGKTGDSLVSYSNDIKSDGIIIYTIGFFSGISDEQTRNECRSLMGRLASRGYHFEGNSLSELSSFFNDMALMASDKSVTHIEVACPVDVKVSYNGETLSSAEDSLCTRTSFGTLMFDGNENDPTKIIRLSEDVDFTVEIIGTGKGTMDYTISYVDENGNYTDTRSIKKVPVTKEFTAVTTTAKTETTTMKVDADGDGKVDLVYENSGKKETNITDAKQFAEKVMKITAIVVASILGVIVIIILIVKIVPVIKEKKKQKAERKANMPEVRKPVSYTGKKSKSAPVTVMTPAYKFCFNCGEKLENGVNFCGNCGNEQPDMKDKEDEKSSESFVDKKAAVNAKQIKHKTKIQNAPLVFCPECGGKIPEGATFCGNCGKSLK